MIDPPPTRAASASTPAAEVVVKRDERRLPFIGPPKGLSMRGEDSKAAKLVHGDGTSMSRWKIGKSNQSIRAERPHDESQEARCLGRVSLEDWHRAPNVSLS